MPPSLTRSIEANILDACLRRDLRANLAVAVRMTDAPTLGGPMGSVDRFAVVCSHAGTGHGIFWYAMAARRAPGPVTISCLLP
jgi:hypothetical protein